jgi:hypothetical protein
VIFLILPVGIDQDIDIQQPHGASPRP